MLELHTSVYEMRVTFANFIDVVTPLIVKSVMSLRILKTYLERCFKEWKAQLDIDGSVDDVMNIVEKKFTIIDVSCLQATVMRYDITEVKPHLSVYKSVIDTFCQVSAMYE